jgi:hypothetical protein
LQPFLLPAEFLLLVFAFLALAMVLARSFERELRDWLYGIASVAQLLLNRDLRV